MKTQIEKILDEVITLYIQIKDHPKSSGNVNYCLLSAIDNLRYVQENIPILIKSDSED